MSAAKEDAVTHIHGCKGIGKNAPDGCMYERGCDCECHRAPAPSSPAPAETPASDACLDCGRGYWAHLNHSIDSELAKSQGLEAHPYRPAQSSTPAQPSTAESAEQAKEWRKKHRSEFVTRERKYRLNEDEDYYVETLDEDAMLAAYTHHLQQQVEQLKKELREIREYAAGGEAQSYPCPLCRWDNGKLMEECCSHRTNTRLELTNRTLREALQKIALASPHSQRVVWKDGIDIIVCFDNCPRCAIDALLTPKGGKDGQ